MTAYEDPLDRRNIRVKITPQEKQVLEDIEPNAIESNNETFSVFQENELDLFASLLARLVTHLDQHES